MELLDMARDVPGGAGEGGTVQVATSGGGDRPERAASGDGESVDVVHDILNSRGRRFVLSHLLAGGGSLQLSALTNRLLEDEYDRPVSEVPVTVRQRISLDRYHSHVPKLDDNDVVEYCGEAGTVSLVCSDPAFY